MGTAKKAIYLIFMILIANLRLTAQENNVTNVDLEKDKAYITAYADNYYPKLNEPVTITLQAHIPEGYPELFYKIGVTRGDRSVIVRYMDSLRIGFNILRKSRDEDTGAEIISGKMKYGKRIEKAGTIEMKLIVKFTKSRYVRIGAGMSNARGDSSRIIKNYLFMLVELIMKVKM